MKLCILDRDGVINEDSDEFIKSVDEWVPIPGSLEAIARLSHADYRIFVVTNQSGIGRGLFDIETLNAIHHKMHDELQKLGGRIEAVLFCPHTPDDGCSCRKPKPALLLEIARRTHLPLEEAYVVGDSLRDLQAAKSAKAKPILVRTGKGNRTIKQHSTQLDDVPVYNNLAEAVDMIIKTTEVTFT